MAEFLFESSPDSLWMPVYTQPLHECRLRDYMNARNIPCYLPMLPEWKIQKVNSVKRSYEYKKVVYRPMFRGYLFARLTEEDKLNCWQSKSVVSYLNVPHEAQKSFIDELKRIQMIELLGKDAPVEIGNNINEGDEFVIESGIFEGTRGKLLKKNRMFLWIVAIECMHSCLSVEIDPTKYQMRNANEK